MDFSAAALWWVTAGIAVAAELATGTFYLLMIALGLAAAAVAASGGLAFAGQVACAALVGGGATALMHVRRRLQPRSAPVRENPDVYLDIGAQVSVAAWADGGTSRVAYRGSSWNARLAPGARPQPGFFRVAAIEGNWLVLAPAEPSQSPPV